MKTLTWIIAFTAIVGIAVAAYVPVARFLKERSTPKWRTQEVTEGSLVHSVNATGKVEPTKKVTIGAFVSGPVSEILVDFNSKVQEGQLLARIDPRLYESSMQRDMAILKTREAEVERATALLQQAKNDERRSVELQSSNADFVSQTDMDQLRFTRMAREADLTVTKTAVDQALAQLQNSTANLAYTEIKSPVSGIIINRKVDTGQTLAAQFQTPELFIVAPDMDKRMHIYASVDEADIGLIRRAQETNQPVRFTVDAYADELFESGKIVQVRLSSSESQNVITYPVIVETPNDQLKLLPGMTANLSFQIESREKVIKIPNAALRFYPERKHVHPLDLAILDGVEEVQQLLDSGNGKAQSAEEKAEASRSRNKRHVWYQDGLLLRAIPVQLGMSDSRFTELIMGDLKPGMKLIIGEQPKS